MEEATRKMNIITLKLAASCTAVQQSLDIGHFFLTAKIYLRHDTHKTLEMTDEEIDEIWKIPRKGTGPDYTPRAHKTHTLYCKSATVLRCQTLICVL